MTDIGVSSEIGEREMLEAFRVQVASLLRESHRFIKPDDQSWDVGIESEVALHGEGVSEKERDLIVDDLVKDGVDAAPELGAHQIETRTGPVCVLGDRGVDEIQRQLYRNDWFVNSSVSALATGGRRLGVLRIGANPFLPVENPPRSSGKKYQLVPDYYNQHRGTCPTIGLPNLSIPDASIVSLFQAFQINVQCTSLEQAIDRVNRSLFIAPYLLALFGNSRFLALRDTGLSDLRMMAWEKTFTLPGEEQLGFCRIGLPERYFDGPADYFKRMERFPFILTDNPEEAFKVAMGMTYLDARLKIINNAAIVELRILPTQPTVQNELTAMLFFLGRLRYSEMTKEPLPPIDFVRLNRFRAMKDGIESSNMFFYNDYNSMVRCDFVEGIFNEIVKAQKGLRDLGLLEKVHWLDSFFDLTPGFYRCKVVRLPEVLSAALSRYRHPAEYIPPEVMEQALIETQMLKMAV